MLSDDASYYIDRLNDLIKQCAADRRGAVPATDSQLDFINKLLSERENSDSDVVGICRYRLDAESGAPSLTKAQASKMIESLLEVKVPRVPKPGMEVTSPSVEIPYGTYTMLLNDDDYVTLKVEKASFIKDKDVTMVSYLSGSDNETAYTGFAFVGNNGLNVWKKFKENSRITNAAQVLWDIAKSASALADAHEAFFKFAEGHALQSGCCARCGKTLTVPASLHRGLGPECASKEGL
jgi:hypothetical protein